MMREPSKYAPIWKALKEKKYCLITCPDQQKATIKKAVIKRKDVDIAFKRNTKNVYRLDVDDSKEGLIEFRLTKSMNNLTEDDF